MLSHPSLLIALIHLVDVIPLPPTQPRRGHPKVYSDPLFLKALVIMIVRHLSSVHAVLPGRERRGPPHQHRVRQRRIIALYKFLCR